jgi:hypothetical protein
MRVLNLLKLFLECGGHFCLQQAMHLSLLQIIRQD